MTYCTAVSRMEETFSSRPNINSQIPDSQIPIVRSLIVPTQPHTNSLQPAKRIIPGGLTRLYRGWRPALNICCHDQSLAIQWRTVGHGGAAARSCPNEDCQIAAFGQQLSRRTRLTYFHADSFFHYCVCA